jgi:hypothetical protein
MTSLTVSNNKRPFETRKHNLDAIARMKKRQQGRCTLCKKEVTKLQMDHCHSSHLTRGLLCIGCNLRLGRHKDDKDRMTRLATSYAKSAPLRSHWLRTAAKYVIRWRHAHEAEAANRAAVLRKGFGQSA